VKLPNPRTSSLYFLHFCFDFLAFNKYLAGLLVLLMVQKVDLN
jgi:hypothetical protein